MAVRFCQRLYQIVDELSIIEVVNRYSRDPIGR